MSLAELLSLIDDPQTRELALRAFRERSHNPKLEAAVEFLRLARKAGDILATIRETPARVAPTNTN